MCPQRRDGSGPLPFQRGGDAPGDRFGGPAKRVRVEVRVAGCCRGVSVPEQLADDRQAEPTAGPEARIGVAKIVQANAFKPGLSRHRPPWPL